MSSGASKARLSLFFLFSFFKSTLGRWKCCAFRGLDGLFGYLLVVQGREHLKWFLPMKDIGPAKQTSYLSIFLHQHSFRILKIYPKNARKSRHFKPSIFLYWRFHSFNWNYIQILYVYVHYTHYQWVKHGLILLNTESCYFSLT